MPILLVGDSVSDTNLFYQTHFLAGDRFVYLETGRQKMLVTTRLEEGRAQKESIVREIRTFEDYGYRDLLRQLNDPHRAFNAMLLRILEDATVVQVTVEASFPALYADHLRDSGIAVDIEPLLFRDERRCKTPEELAAIEQAQRVTEHAAARAIEMIEQSEDHHGTLYWDGAVLTSERVRAELDIVLIGDDMDTSSSAIVAGGPGAADPHWTGAGPLKSHEAIVLDVSPRSRRARYYADITRTVVKGSPGRQLQSMYDAVLRAQEAALAQIRAGANGRHVHGAVEAIFEAAGFEGEGPGPRFIHTTGHGVGLNVHEPPSLGLIDIELIENDVVTVEPGLYNPAIGAVRIEDLVVVTRDGYRNLTTFPKRFCL